MGKKEWIWTITLGLGASGLFLIECVVFHFRLWNSGDVFVLPLLIIVPGLFIVLHLRRFLKIEINGVETLSLSAAVGFGIVPILLEVFQSSGQGRIEFGRVAETAAIIMFSSLIADIKHKKMSLPMDWIPPLKQLFIFAIGVLLFFAVYNLQQFHYLADGSIVTHGLFGVDIPFLAGEVHGIRDFGSLRDLHQMAQPWHYHDWTYQLLSLALRERTVNDIAFVAPLVGYTLLAFSIYTLALRLTRSKYIAYVSVAMWFLVSGLQGGELGSYALSPSFVFGSMIMLNIILLIGILCKENRSSQRWGVYATLVFLLFELSRTKVSSYLVVMGAMGITGLIMLRRKKNIGFQLMIVSILSFGIFILNNAGANPLMPSGDFVIGAPLMGYANHLSAILHLSAESLNPVSDGLRLRWQSILIIPFFVFHFLRFALLDAKLVSAIVIFIAFRKVLWKEYDEIIWLIVILIPLGFLLPVLYSPAWYPLGLSFYAPLVSEQAAIIIIAVGFGVFAKVGKDYKDASGFRMEKITLRIVAVILIAGIVFNIRNILQEDNARPSILSASLIHAMGYLQEKASDRDIIASMRYDEDTSRDESYYWFSALSGHAVVSEGAKYGSLLSAVADTNSEKGLHSIPAADSVLMSHRALLDTIYLSRDTNDVRAVIVKTRCAFIIEGLLHGPALSIDPNTIAYPVFTDSEYKIWKIRR